MDNTDAETSELEEYRICHACIDEKFLKAEVKNEGEVAECSYCAKKRESISLKELADRVHTAFGEHFYRTSDQPDHLQSMLMNDPESSYQWDREGSQTKYAISEAAGINEDAAEHVRQILEEQHYDLEAARAGEESAYDENAYYEEKGPEDRELRAEWSYFERSLKTESRLFNRGAEAVLTNVFEELAGHKTHDGKTVIVDAGPGHPISALFRARVFHPDDEKLEAAIKRPDIELGPPPSQVATPGRMNSRGISVFYGSTKTNIALAEVRPPVGSVVAIARFMITRPVRLLDVEAFRSLLVTGSVFDSTYMRRLEKAKFLKRLSNRITIPVMPADEPADYLVTQAIADYLANLNDPSIDGVIYRSVQDGPGVNVVLFNKSSRVAELEIPEKTVISASLGSMTEDGYEIDYQVWEEVPRGAGKRKKRRNSKVPTIVEYVAGSYSEDADIRQPTLSVDTKNVVVHHVERARYEAEEHEVSRHRMEKQRVRGTKF